MALIALLSAHRETAGVTGPLAVLPLAGRTVLERQARQAARAGVSRIVLDMRAAPAPLVQAIERIKALGLEVELARGLAEVGRLIQPEDEVLLFADAVVLDDRMVEQVVGCDAPLALTVAMREPDGPGLDLIDGETVWAGLAKAPGALVSDTAWRHDDWDLPATLVRLAVQQGARRLALADIETYAPNRRRVVPLLWHAPASRAEADVATRDLQRSAQKGCLDWPARFLHPPVEDGIVRLLLPTRITPNMVTVVTGMVGFASVFAFAKGWLWAGLLLMLFNGPLDGVDGKLARTRLEFSRWGDLEHVVDKLVEYGAFLALGGWLAGQAGHYGPWVVAILLIFFALAEALQGEIYYRFTGRQLDDRGPLERAVRLVAGRRNTFFWTLVIFAAFGAWETGLIVLSAYSVLTFFVAQALFIRGMRAFALAEVPVAAANFRRTAYPFLATPRRSAR